MPISLTDLVSLINPERTALVLGAGASVPSGAPSGIELAHHLWRQIAKSDPQGDDLVETASVLSRKYGRREIVEQVIGRLKGLRPTGGLSGIPMMGWKAIYTTNFDMLMEKSFKAANIPLALYRSNFDFSAHEANVGVKFYKIHGCISQDRSLGDKPSMILTEEDYDKFAEYRETLFGALNSTLLEGDVLIVGQSLRDPHLSSLVKKILDSKQNGSPGKIFMLVYDHDDLRAPLLEDRGIKIAFAGIDELVHQFGNGPSQAASAPPTDQTASPLPLSLVASAQDVTVARSFAPQVTRMFHGSPASFADIAAGATFERATSKGLLERLSTGEVPVLAITGAAGVGKTTFARQLTLGLAEQFDFAWEHKSDFPFQQKPWITVEQTLRAAGRKGVLLVDECTSQMRAINQLVEHLADVDDPGLKLIVTANSAQWTPRMKSPVFFAKKAVSEISSLEDQEIYSLINLVEHNPDISALVTHDFKKKARSDQFDTLRKKCSADMFVCLKNVFATESLDDIILEEYNNLGGHLQEYYRYVAALQAVGARVHRQLIIRMLGMPPQDVSAALGGLHGIVDEYDIDPKNGIYGWNVRHLVIARKIAEYKFSGVEEIVALFETLIDNVNPAMSIELHTIRNICDAEYGIGRIGDAGIRKRLYNKLIDVVPGERIPWHRLIKESLNEGDASEVEYLIRGAEVAVGRDAPIDRFRVRLAMLRAQKTPRINDSDRLAILRKAYEEAISNIRKHSWDKFSYAIVCDVAVKLVERGDSEYLLEESIQLFREAAERIQDPEMNRQIRSYEGIQGRLRAA